VIVSGLSEGAYYWVVQSYDAKEQSSLESEKNRFTIIPKGNYHGDKLGAGIPSCSTGT